MRSFGNWTSATGLLKRLHFDQTATSLVCSLAQNYVTVSEMSCRISRNADSYEASDRVQRFRRVSSTRDYAGEALGVIAGLRYAVSLKAPSVDQSPEAYFSLPASP